MALPLYVKLGLGLVVAAGGTFLVVRVVRAAPQPAGAPPAAAPAGSPPVTPKGSPSMPKGSPQTPKPASPPTVDLDKIAKEQARQREINRKRGEAAENAWKDKPIGYEKEAEALASSYPVVKLALQAIFAGIRAVVSMPHIEQVSDPVLDLENAMPLDQRELLQFAALRVPYPYDGTEWAYSRQQYAGRALYKEARARGLIKESDVDANTVAEVQGLAAMAEQAIKVPFSPQTFAQHNPNVSGLSPALAPAWDSGWDGDQSLVELVDRGGGGSDPNLGKANSNVVLAIAQREGSRARSAGALRAQNPFRPI